MANPGVPGIMVIKRMCMCMCGYSRIIGTVIVGAALAKLLSILSNIIRRQLQLAPWRVEVVSDNDPRIHPIDPHGVSSTIYCHSARV